MKGLYAARRHGHLERSCMSVWVVKPLEAIDTQSREISAPMFSVPAGREISLLRCSFVKMTGAEWRFVISSLKGLYAARRYRHLERSCIPVWMAKPLRLLILRVERSPAPMFFVPARREISPLRCALVEMTRRGDVSVIRGVRFFHSAPFRRNDGVG